MPVCHMRKGDMGAAVLTLARGMEIALRIGHREAELLGGTLQGKIAMTQGAYEDALALFRRGCEASEAVGLPYLQALALCVIGTCYEQIGGPMMAVALDYHRQALEKVEQPAGIVLATWVWSEVGACALSAGDVGKAHAMFERALTERSAAMLVMRPSALRGACLAALAEGRMDEAQRWFEELEAYVTEHGMMDQMPALLLTGALVDAAAGQHEAALERLARCEEMVGPAGMIRPLFDVLSARARSLTALGQAAEAAAARAGARRVMDEIAARFRDDSLRAAFVASASAVLDAGT